MQKQGRRLESLCFAFCDMDLVEGTSREDIFDHQNQIILDVRKNTNVIENIIKSLTLIEE